MDRCPRCSRPVFNDHGELHCLSCGELTRPEVAARARQLAVEAEAYKAAQLAAGKTRTHQPHREAGRLGMMAPAEMDALVAEFGDLPQEAWDEACQPKPGSRGYAQMREALVRKRREVQAGTFRAWLQREVVREVLNPYLKDDPAPSDPVDWIGWRLRHGMPISQDIIERELRLSWWQASEALAKWRQRLEGEAAGQ